ncbi:uncharacterized protein LOC144149970 isoform X3 [Haemaphysalis longicornis]
MKRALRDAVLEHARYFKITNAKGLHRGSFHGWILQPKDTGSRYHAYHRHPVCSCVTHQCRLPDVR